MNNMVDIADDSRRKATSVVTNADRIRSMTDEELAEFMAPISSCYGCPARTLCDKDDSGSECHKIVEAWLKQPYKEVSK